MKGEREEKKNQNKSEQASERVRETETHKPNKWERERKQEI